MPCSYFSQPAAGDFATHAGCARVAASGDLEVQPKHLAAATGNEGVGTLLVANRWYYVLPDGESLEVVTYDNGPDHFSEGLVRGLRDGKIGYWNERLEPVVAPRWDWGWPFEGGVALVCSGCERERSPGEEHTSVVGGEWGAIDAQGHEVVSLRGSREEVLDALEADGPAEGWRKGAGGRVPATSTGHFNWPLQLEVLASSRPVLRAVRVEPKVTLRYE